MSIECHYAECHYTECRFAECYSIRMGLTWTKERERDRERDCEYNFFVNTTLGFCEMRQR